MGGGGRSALRAAAACAWLCAAPTTTKAQRDLAGAYVPDILQPLYEWNMLQHSSSRFTSTVRHDMITSTGDVVIQNGVLPTEPGTYGRDTTDGLVRVRQLDSPKEPCQRWCPPLGGACTTLCEPLSGRAALRDVLTAKPTTERPAIAEVSVPLTAAHCGHNRLHAFVHVSARECVSVRRANATGNGTYLEQLCTPPYDDVAGVLSAVLAPFGASHAVLRTVFLRRYWNRFPFSSSHFVLVKCSVAMKTYGNPWLEAQKT